MDPATIAAIMAAVGPLLSAFTGNKEKHGSTYNPKQLGLIDQIVGQVKGMGNQGIGNIQQNPQFQQGQDWLSQLFNNPEFFNQFEAPLQRQFEENTIPDLANRFASMGSGGSLGSTGFRNQLAREGSNLSTNLAALRGGLQQQGVNQSLQYAQQPTSNYLSMLQNALQPTQNVYQPSSTGMF